MKLKWHNSKKRVEEGKVIRKKQKVDIWRYKKQSKNELHPTIKPVALVEQAIISSSQRNNIVLDLFLGSGSTLIACEKTNRACYGMELDPKYVSVILDRWSKFTGKDPIRLNDNKKWSEICKE